MPHPNTFSIMYACHGNTDELLHDDRFRPGRMLSHFHIHRSEIQHSAAAGWTKPLPHRLLRYDRVIREPPSFMRRVQLVCPTLRSNKSSCTHACHIELYSNDHKSMADFGNLIVQQQARKFDDSSRSGPQASLQHVRHEPKTFKDLSNDITAIPNPIFAQTHVTRVSHPSFAVLHGGDGKHELYNKSSGDVHDTTRLMGSWTAR